MVRVQIERLARGDEVLARQTFALMAAVFGEEFDPLTDEYLDELLTRDGFWALCARLGSQVVGGLTAHTLPMTRSASPELFVYDVAVSPICRRQGVGTLLVGHLRERAAAAGIGDVFVAADNDDEHALGFYRALGATGSAVTVFTFSSV